MTDYGIAVHEGAHALLAAMYKVPFHFVNAGERHGKVFLDRDAMEAFLLDPEPFNMPMQVAGMVSLAGPIAEARWELNIGQMNRHVGGWFDNLEKGYGGQADLPNARMWAEEAGVDYEALADTVIDILDTDKCWLAVQRVADALVERRTLMNFDVERLIYGGKRGGNGNGR